MPSKKATRHTLQKEKKETKNKKHVYRMAPVLTILNEQGEAESTDARQVEWMQR